MSFACLEWNHESSSSWLSRYTNWAKIEDVIKMNMRWSLQTLVSIATEHVKFGSVAMNSVRICALVLLIISDPNSFMLTHMTRVQRESQWKVTVEQRSLCFFTFKLRVFHLFNSSSISRRMREEGETDVHQTWPKRASTLYVTDTPSNFLLPLTFSVFFYFSFFSVFLNRSLEISYRVWKREVVREFRHVFCV